VTDRLEAAKGYLRSRGLYAQEGGGRWHLGVPGGSRVLAAWSAQRQSGGVRRDYEAGQTGRLTQSWVTTSMSANQEIYRSLRAMRARARQLAKNDAYAKRFIAMVVQNVVGPAGIRLQSLAADLQADYTEVPDDPARKIIEREWRLWGKRGQCEVTGGLSWRGVLAMIAAGWARDGEILVRRLRGARYGRHGYALQLLDPDRLDETYNNDLPNGNQVRMGVELNAMGRPVAYHLLAEHPGDFTFVHARGGRKRERVPASDVWHDFVRDRPEQVRGVPPMHAAMIRLHHMGRFDEAAVIAARIGASELGFLQRPDGEPPEDFAEGADAKDAWKFYIDVEPGKWRSLPPGYEVKDIPRKYPEANYAAFAKACLRGIASGLNVAYNSLANDLEGVNYSSIRQGVLDERDAWRLLQSWMIEGTCETLATDWIEMSLLTRAVPLDPGKLGKFSAFGWQARRWSWVDPKNDVESDLLQANAGLKSRTRIAADQGDDLEDVFAEIQAEKALAEKYGVELKALKPASAPAPTPSPAAVAPAAGASDEEEQQPRSITVNVQRADEQHAKALQEAVRQLAGAVKATAQKPIVIKQRVESPAVDVPALAAAVTEALQPGLVAAVASATVTHGAGADRKAGVAEPALDDQEAAGQQNQRAGLHESGAVDPDEPAEAGLGGEDVGVLASEIGDGNQIDGVPASGSGHL
jgi:lambda family phage portal protein